MGVLSDGKQKKDTREIRDFSRIFLFRLLLVKEAGL
jgi:hypothetical protein